MNGIVAYGSYIPYHRLERKAVADALGAPAGKGTRSVASYDEDTTSLAVEAARAALRGAPGVAPAAVYFATAAPAYLDKTNAAAIHAALDLGPGASAFKSFGHPIGASGLRMLFECWLQLRGEAGRRQIASIARGRKLALTHNLGGAPGECVSFVSVVGSSLSA